METTEINKKERIRHCYPRKEIYHRWIHSPEYVYTPKKGHRCAGAGNYLRICDLFYGKTNEEIKKQWIFNREYIIAIIDRDNKRIIINIKYNQHTYYLKRAIPDDFEIFYSNEIIVNPNILQNNEELFKIHARYLIECIADYYREEYLCLAGKVKMIYNHNDTISRYKTELKDFVNKHKLDKYKWYNDSLDKHTIRQHYGWNAKNTIINLPSIKEIITDTIFSNTERLIIEQHIFYSEYCYGNGVSIKFIKEHWNKVPTKEEAIKYFENKTEFRNQHSWIEDNNKLNWQDLIKHSDEILNSYIKNERERCIKISDENLNNAWKELNSFDNYSVNAWRKGIVNSKREVTYRRFVPNYRKGQIGKWENSKLTNNINHFENTQLKLSINKTMIITSRNASVPLDDAIKKFKFIHIYINNCIYRNLTSYSFDKVNVGIYNLRFIKYTNKKTDTGKLLDRKEWLIQIGCHALWMDDILNFIYYYNLENEFGIDDKKKDVKLKIQIKK